MPTALSPARRVAVLLAFVAALLVGAATTQARPVALTKSDLPGAKKSGGSVAGLRTALTSAMRGGPRGAVSKAPAVVSNFRSGPYRLLNGSVELSSPSAAKAARRAAGTRKRIGAKASTATVAVQSGPLVGFVTVSAKGRNASVATYAASVARTLQARLDAAASVTVASALEEDTSGSKSSALALFKLAYGDMPGAKIPPGRRGTVVEGTLALTRVWAVRDQLTPAQRAAFDRAAGNSAAKRSTRAARGKAARLAHGYGLRPSEPHARRLDLTPDPVLQATASHYVAMYSDPSRLGPTNPVLPEVYRSSTSLGDRVAGDAFPVDAAGNGPAYGEAFHHCRIRLDPVFSRQSADAQSFALAHEVFHCMTFRVTDNWDVAVRGWVTEGLAHWGASQILPAAYPTAGSDGFTEWLEQPEVPLFERSYTAVGFWAHQHERLGNLWPQMQDVLRGGDNARTFNVAGGYVDETLATSASALLRTGGAPPAWVQTQPWVLSDAAVHTPRGVMADASAAITVAPHANKLTDIAPFPEQPVVELTRSSGHVRATDGSADFPDAAGRFFCFPAGACVCPPNQTVAGLPSPLPEVASLTVALSGDVPGGAATIQRHPMKEYCKKRDPADPAGDGGSNGDPHLTSHDGLRYDFQAAGEFVLVRGGSDLEVQARQEPLKIGKSVVRTMTVNTQLAFKVGAARLTIDTGKPLVVRVNGGSPQTPAAGVQLSVGDGTLAFDGEEYLLTWPDGSAATVWSVGESGVAFSIGLADARKAKTSGLLGNFDGDPMNDLRTRGGNVFAFEAKPEDWPGLNRVTPNDPTGERFSRGLYDTVGDTWRISQKESLLDYRKGETTKTFTDQSIPQKLFTAEDLSASKRAKAEAICRAAGVTAPAALRDCILDVVLTGQSAFASAAAREEANAAPTRWSRLAAGGARTGPLSAARTGDGTIHLAWSEQLPGDRYSIVHDALPAGGGERGPVTIAPYAGSPYLYAGADGSLRMVASIFDLGPPLLRGVIRYSARAPYAGWSADPIVTTTGVPTGVPMATEAAGHTITVHSPTGTGRVFVDAGGSGDGEPLNGTAATADCLALQPAVAASGAEAYAGFIRFGCAQSGLFVSAINPSTGSVGDAIAVPESALSSTAGTTGLTRLAMAGRPGGGVFLAYARQDGATWSAMVWRIGSQAPFVAASGLTSPPRSLQISAEPSSGNLWVAWQTEAALYGKGRLAVRRTNAAADGWAGAARELSFLSDADKRAVPVYPWDVVAHDGGLDVIAGYPAGTDYPGAIWRTTLSG